MKTLTIRIDEKFYNELKSSCPLNVKIGFHYVELLKKGLKDKRS